jgi:glucose/arabinose dehydrogenase
MEARIPLNMAAAVFCCAVVAGCSSSSSSGTDSSTGGGTDTNSDQTSDTGSGGTHKVSMVTVADGLSHPWGMAFLPGGDILLTERPGRLRLVKDGKLVEAPIPGLPGDIRAEGEGGLLDIALHPDFATNRLVYFAYSEDTGSGLVTAVARAVYQNGTLSAPEVIFRADPPRGGSRHFGSRLLFEQPTPDETFLYISLGERGDSAQAQNPANALGSVVRVYDDGTPPLDNPQWPDGLPQIFSIGHRNPEGLALQPGTGLIWSSEHGPKWGDEINIIRAGRNYGWPEISYGVNYDGSPVGDGSTSREGMEQPVYYWDTEDAIPTAPSGMIFYTGDKFPNWKGDLFIGALAGQALIHLSIDGTAVNAEERLLTQENKRIRDVVQGPNGYLWILTDEDPGQLIRLEPAN